MSELAYVGRRPCGCVRTLNVHPSGLEADERTLRGLVATFDDWTKRGLRIDVMPVAEAWRAMAGCPHEGAARE